MSKFLDIRNEMLNDFDGSREICSVNYSKVFDNLSDIIESSKKFAEEIYTEQHEKRRVLEEDFYNFLNSQLNLRILELKNIANINIHDTRKIVSISENCISLIQILFREDIYLNVYFRSSDFDGALPVDLEFVSSILYNLKIHLIKFKGHKGYEDINDDVLNEISQKKIRLKLIFGSLHRTNNE